MSPKAQLFFKSVGKDEQFNNTQKYQSKIKPEDLLENT